MIQYDLRLIDNVHWENMERQFRRFLSRHLKLHVSSVEIQGVISSNYTWFIMKGTPLLLQALIVMAKDPNANESGWKRFVHYVAAAIPAVAVVGVVGVALVRGIMSH